MEQHRMQDPFENNVKKIFCAWPWYALLITGIALSGIFPWLMVIYACYQHKRKRMAFSALIINIIIFFIITWFALTSRLLWWQLICFSYSFNIVWALSAWMFQNKFVGSAGKRYIFSQWRDWIYPILIGLTIVAGTTVL
ncbi:MAG: hypothetical protein KAX15_08020, partial [Candidatus Omnitrophica bacterium]|nr:hypothetical protein [Candidatus Omnitrophota bacterium]